MIVVAADCLEAKRLKKALADLAGPYVNNNNQNDQDDIDQDQANALMGVEPDEN